MSVKIVPNEAENKLFERLRVAAEERGLVLRAAGGWVRDKLLGKESHDIDIAIDKMTGQRFAREVLQIPASVIAANPEQSKQLETTKVCLEGFDIDLANLRDETGGGAYADDSRILTENIFATPEIDASRRDFTVNAMFYNLHTQQVEDYVGGLHDLGLQTHSLVIRTPLEPLKTFKDDPLRKLRALRFRAKLANASIDSQTLNAMGADETRAALRTKVSWERVATELLGVPEEVNGERCYKYGILNGDFAVESLALMYATGLLDDVLYVPLMKDFAPFNMDQNSSHHIYGVWKHTLEVVAKLKDHPFVRGLHVTDPEQESLLLFAAICHDLGKRDPKSKQVRGDGFSSYVGHEDVSAEVARDICNKLRLSNSAKDFVVAVCRHHMDPHGREWGDRDATLRRFINKLPNVWEHVIVHAYCDVAGTGTLRPPGEYQRYIDKIERCHWLLKNDPQPASSRKPALDGNIIMRCIPGLKQGPWIKDTVARLNEIKFENPFKTEEELTATVLEWADSITNDPKYAKFKREVDVPPPSDI